MVDLCRLAVGEQAPPRAYKVGQDTIDRYAVVSGDRNPLHIDPAFAATTPYGRTIAHGMMTLCFLSDSMEEWAGAAWAETGALEVAFLAPVYADETVSVNLEIVGKDDALISCKATCTVNERIVMAGEVRVALASKVGTAGGDA